VATWSGESRRIRLTLYAEGASFWSPSLSYGLELWTSLRLPGVSSDSNESFSGSANHDRGVVTRDFSDENIEIEREGGGLLV